MNERLRQAYARHHAKRDAQFALGLPMSIGEMTSPAADLGRWSWYGSYKSTDYLRYMEYEPTPAVWWWPEQKGMATIAMPNDRRFIKQDRRTVAGLRFVGAVVPETATFMSDKDASQLGWFDNDYGEYRDGGDGLIWGVVYQLTGRNKMMRTVAGYQYGCNDEVVLDLSRIYESPANPGDSDATREAARAADDMAMRVAEEEREYQRQQREEETMEEWLTEARRYAHHIWCYGQLIDDHIERAENAASRGEDVYEFVEWLGEKYDLTRADQDWGIHQDVPFNKEK